MAPTERSVDLAIIGAGPAGLAAAIQSAQFGLTSVVVDEQPEPGGQVYRALEKRQKTGASSPSDRIDRLGQALIGRFRASDARYQPSTQVWQIEPSWSIFATSNGQARRFSAKRLLLAVGALERPIPFSGWTLPGVMTVGAAQIAMKTSNIVPKSPFWIAGQGPLVLLYATQLLNTGIRPAGLLLTTPPGATGRAIKHAPRALLGWPYLARGLAMSAQLRLSSIPMISDVDDIRAIGGETLEGVEYWRAGVATTVEATTLLVHEGVVPSTHMSLAIGCAHTWDDIVGCLKPSLDQWGAASISGVYIAGDCGGIGGSRAAELSGALAAIGVARDLGRIDRETSEREASPLRRALQRDLAVRPLLDAIYRPRQRIRTPDNDVIVCRCEERTAGDIRDAVAAGCLGPAQVKSRTRVGMGPCQGRQCALTVTELIASARHIAPAEAGYFSIRPPLKPVTIGELAAFAEANIESGA